MRKTGPLKDGAIQGELIAEAVLNKPESREIHCSGLSSRGSRSDNPCKLLLDFAPKKACICAYRVYAQEAIS